MEAGGIGGGGWSGDRAGARVLGLLAAPLVAPILHKLSRSPSRLVELRREMGAPPKATLRTRLGELAEVGAIARRRLHPFPSTREYVLTDRPGSELLFVASTLEGWLARAPRGPLDLSGEAGQAAVEALLEGWSSTMLRALAAGPLTLTELDRAIRSLGFQAIERRLAALRLSGLVEVRPRGEEGAPYAVTEWLRQGTASLAAGARWERSHLPGVAAPVAPLDVEAGLLLAVPLVRLPPELSGSCRMAVELGDERKSRLAGVTVEIEAGRIVSCTTRLGGDPDAWATGSVAAWLRVAIEADPGRLELGGRERLARGLLDTLNQALFPPRLI